MSSIYTLAYLRLRPSRGTAYAAALLGIAACHDAAPPPPPPMTVVALPVHAAGSHSQSFRYPVEATARYANVVSFRVAGKIIERRVRLGDRVRQGQVLARLDAADAEKQAAVARATLDAAEHRFVFAQQTLDRDNAQFAEQLISQSAIEQSRDAYSTAQAARSQAAAQYTVAGNTLKYHTLIADHDGAITSENADTGQNIAAGQAVYGLAWSGDVDAVLDVAASDAARITVGDASSVTFGALPGRQFQAQVREVAPAADAQSRTYRVKLTLAHPGPGVLIGMTGEASFSPASTPGAAPAIQIPTTAIFHQGADPAVWLVRAADSTLELRRITVASFTERSALVAAGLTDGDVVVMSGVHTVFAGEHVSAVKPLYSDEASTADSKP